MLYLFLSSEVSSAKRFSRPFKAVIEISAALAQKLFKLAKG